MTRTMTGTLISKIADTERQHFSKYVLMEQKCTYCDIVPVRVTRSTSIS